MYTWVVVLIKMGYHSDYATVIQVKSMTKKEAEIKVKKEANCRENDYVKETFGPFNLPKEI